MWLAATLSCLPAFVSSRGEMTNAPRNSSGARNMQDPATNLRRCCESEKPIKTLLWVPTDSCVRGTPSCSDRYEPLRRQFTPESAPDQASAGFCKRPDNRLVEALAVAALGDLHVPRAGGGVADRWVPLDRVRHQEEACHHARHVEILARVAHPHALRRCIAANLH